MKMHEALRQPASEGAPWITGNSHTAGEPTAQRRGGSGSFQRLRSGPWPRNRSGENGKWLTPFPPGPPGTWLFIRHCRLKPKGPTLKVSYFWLLPEFLRLGRHTLPVREPAEFRLSCSERTSSLHLGGVP